MNWVTRTVDRLDQIKPTRLILTNVVLALIVLLSNGAVLFLARTGKDAELGDAEPYVYFSIALAGATLASGLVAWARPTSRAVILRIHSVVLILLAIYALLYSLALLANGIPRGNFGWDAGFFALILAYPVYLARRTILPTSALAIPVVRYGHLLVAALSIAISAGVFWRMETWSPSEADFKDEALSPDETLRVPRAQAEPAVPEVSWDGVLSGDVVTLLSTSFELAPGEDKNPTRPFVQNGLIPWGRDARAHSGQAAINVIPHGNPGDMRYFGQSVSPVLLSSQLGGGYVPFQVGAFRRVELEFWRLSTSNPSATFNCMGSLIVEYRLDSEPWQSKMDYCGSHKSKPQEWKHSVLEFDTAGHKVLELRFDYDYPPDNHKDRSAVYLVDDLTVRGYR